MLVAALVSSTSFVFAEPESVVPARQNEWWMARHEAKLKEVQERKDEIDLVLIGDSITHYMDNRAPGIIPKTFPGMRHLNLGYSADKTENVLWRLRNGEIDGLSPKLTMIMIGTNNTGHRQDSPEVTAAAIKLIVDEVRQRMPHTKVLLLSIFPRGASPDDKLRQINHAINQQLPPLAEDPAVFHLDINDRFLNADGELLKESMPDLLHPNREGYEIWMDAVKPTVQRMLKTE